MHSDLIIEARSRDLGGGFMVGRVLHKHDSGWWGHLFSLTKWDQWILLLVAHWR